MQLCKDTPDDHYQCGCRASYNCYRHAEAEQHFLRALELSDPNNPDFTLANILRSYGWLLIRLKRIDEGIALIERRLAMPRFNGDDRLERKCTAWQLAEFKANQNLSGDRR